MSSFSPLETEALKLILYSSLNELGILQVTLQPTQPFNIHYKCPKISISPLNQDIWKQEHLRKFIEYVIQGTVEELNKYGTFRALSTTTEELFDVMEESIKIPDEDVYLKSKIARLNEQISQLKIELFDWKNPWNKVAWENELELKEEAVKMSCSNKERYYGKLMEAKYEDNLQSYKMQKQVIEDKQQNVQWRIRIEDRCTREMQSFLNLYRIELEAEFERCIILQEKLSTEKDNKAQLLRINREKLIEDTEAGKKLLVARAAAMRRFRRNYANFGKKKEALLKIQTWWRSVLTTKEILQKFQTKPKTEKVQKKKK